MRQHSYTLLALLLGVLALGLGLVACDSANPIAPSGSTLTVTANPTTIALNQNATLTITGFKPDGNPLNPGSQITLSTDLGTLDTTVVAIGQNGRATTLLRPDGRTGSATVTAALPAGEAMATVAVQIGESAETRPTLLISADPSTIGVNETSIVSVLARNADGSSFGAGGQVRLTTTLGTLDDENLVTDGDGEAETTLRSGSQSGTATIAGTVGASDEVTTDVTIAEGTLTVNASPSRINIEQNSVISVILRTSSGAPLANARVRLRTSLGVLANENLTTDSNGETETTLSPDGRSGTADIVASVDAGSDVTASVTIIRAQIDVDINPRIIDITDDATVTVLLRDEDGIPLVAGHEVRLTANLGTLSPTTVQTNGNGEGVSTYTAGTRAGNDTISAFFGNATTGTDTVDLRAAPAAITLTADTITIAPNVDSTIMLTATVSDAEGLLLSNEVVSFALSAGISGTFSPGRTTTTDSGGVAAVSIMFESTTAPDAGTVFDITARARGENIFDVVTITVQ